MTVVESAQRFAAGAAGRRPRGSRRRRRTVLLVVLAALLLGALAWLIWWSPVLAVREVRVLGVRTIAAEQVRDVAAVPLGVPLARVSATEVAARVTSIGAVRSVEVRYGWPNVLVVAVTEREPVGVVEDGGRTWLLDREGIAYAPAGARSDLPEVTATGGAREAAATVLAELPPSLATRVRTVRARTVDDVVLRLAGGPLVRWGAATDADRKVAVLTALLPRKAREIDVSAPDLPTTLPRTGGGSAVSP